MGPSGRITHVIRYIGYIAQFGTGILFVGPDDVYKFTSLLPKDYYLIPSNNAIKLVCCVP